MRKILDEDNNNSGLKKDKSKDDLLNSKLNDDSGGNINDFPVAKNGAVSICDIELLIDEDKTIPDTKLSSYNIEEEYIGFGTGVNLNVERTEINSKNFENYNNSTIRMCYTSLWRKLPHNIPVREIAISRYHISVLLNNGHVYITLNEMNEDLCKNLNALKRKQNMNNCLENELNLNITNSNVNDISLLENCITRNNWLHIKELDDKQIRGIKISSVVGNNNSFELKYDLKSFVLASLTSEGKILLVEYNSINQITHLKSINFVNYNGLDHFDSKFCKAIDITFSELKPLVNGIEQNESNNNAENNLFPYSYGMAIACLLNDNNSNSIILKKNTFKDDELIILDLPFVCRKVYCGLDIEYGLILLQNGALWNWDIRKNNLRSKYFVSDEDILQNITVRKNLSNKDFILKLNRIQGSLIDKNIIDFSGLNGEFIALSQDGIIHEWNDIDRSTFLIRPFIEEPIIFTPKYHYKVMKEYFLNNNKWSFKNIINLNDNSNKSNSNSLDFENKSLSDFLENEIKDMYDPNNKIIGIWLLEGITLVLYKDSTLKFLYNYIGKYGYNTKIGFISEKDCFDYKQIYINDCIKWSYKLGKCIPANPIALIGLLSDFSKGESLSDKEKQLIIQRSLVKLSLREKPVYRIIACYNSIIFGILRSNPKWRCNKNILKKKRELTIQPDSEMNISTTVNLKELDSNPTHELDINKNTCNKRSFRKKSESNLDQKSSLFVNSPDMNGIQSIETNCTFNNAAEAIELVNDENNSKIDPSNKKHNHSKSINNEKSKANVGSNLKLKKRERRSSSRSNKENISDQNRIKYEDEESLSCESKKLNLVEYEVEQILSVREKPLTKQKEYLVKWKVPGHPVQPTWEPQENLNGCEELVQEFLRSVKTSRSGRLLLPCTITKNN